MMHRRPGGPEGPDPERPPALPHPCCIRGDRAAHVPEDAPRPHALTVTDRLSKPAILVEVASEESRGRVIVCVADRGCWMEDLRPSALEHVDAESPILGVVDVAKPDLVPARAQITGV